MIAEQKHQQYDDWDLPDPHGKDEATVRGVRDDIRQRVQKLATELGCCDDGDDKGVEGGCSTTIDATR